MNYGDLGFRIPKSGDVFIRNQTQENLGQLSLMGKGSNSYFMDPELADLYSRSQSLEEEIILLHKQVADACTKELELLNEKHVLERKLYDLRMALDERHKNALADALKDLATRKAYIEENLKLADELKVMEDEKYIFTSSLLSLLTEYGIRPSLIDASSISSSIKRLYHQMHWRIRASHGSNAYTLQRHSQHPHDMHVESPSNKSRFGGERDMADTKDVNTSASSEFQFPLNGAKLRDVEGHVTKHQSSASYDSEGEALPGIEGFLISGDARPGNALTACGYNINKTSVCIFQWVRHLQDGTTEYVEGATTPEYFVTADDVGKIVAVVCIPMDDSGRQGELVTHFANNQNKIACDPEMQQEIQRYVSAGQASFNVLLLVDSSENWEPANLNLKRSGYQIKINQMDMPLRDEKYSPDLSIKIPFGLSTQFLLTCSDRMSYPFSTSGTFNQHITENDLRLRDIIVLTTRIFQSKALDDKRKGKM